MPEELFLMMGWVGAPMFFPVQAFFVEVEPVTVGGGCACLQHMVELPEAA